MRALAAALTIALLALRPAPAEAARTRSTPTLIVQITFDQLRADLLERYRRVFAGGFRRVLEGGRWFRHGEAAHGLTLSFPGHATLATGLFPAHHGLTANEWWVERGGHWRSEDVSDDSRYRILGRPGQVGASPHELRATTLADWVKAADPQARSVALGTGGTIAIAYGGRHPDAAYWFDSTLARFTTSTYYAAEVAPWIETFNRRGLPAFEAQRWTLTVPPRYRRLARPDAEPYEAGGRNNVFPHVFAVEAHPPAPAPAAPAPAAAAATRYGRWFGETPLKDEALFALAARAVDAERLGRRGHLDYLAIAPDSTDAVGHQYGPSSLEQLDTLLRLDRALGRFLHHLDATVGRGHYLVAISADHGVADPPEEHGLHRITNAEIEALLDRVEAIAPADRGPREALIERIAAELRRSDFIADVYTEARLASAGPDDPYAELYKRSFRPGHITDFPLWSRRERPHHPARYGIIVRFREGMIFDDATAVHGTPYAYDRDVPILFYGAGVRAGSAARGGRTADVAPTLAALAGIAAPPNLDGVVLRQALRALGTR